LDLEFLSYIAHSVYFQQICFHSSIGVHVEKMIFKLEDWFRWPINLPSPDEQRKIAAFLGAVDEKLAALRRKRDLLTDYKRVAMQKIFSQQIRFTHDDGTAFPDWKKTRLSELGQTFGGLAGKSSEDFGLGASYVTYKQVFGSSFIELEKCGKVRIAVNEKQNLVRFGDVLFTTSSETPNEIGFSSVVLDEAEELYLNSFCFGFRPYNENALFPDFARYLFHCPAYRRAVYPLAQGSTRYNLSKGNFLKLSQLVPCLEEQKRIADFLSALDTKIDAVAEQITQMEAFKKGLLQQMFV